MGKKDSQMERELFMRMVHAHDHEMRSLAFRLLGDRDTMDDALQESYLKAFRALPKFRGEAQLRTWLYRIVYNTCLDHLRLRERRKEVSFDALEEAGSGELSRCAGRSVEMITEWDEGLTGALASLTVERRAAVLLVDALGVPSGEAARILGVRAGTLASRLHYARSALRRSLEEGRGHGAA